MARHMHLYKGEQGYIGTLKVVDGKKFCHGGCDGHVQTIHHAKLPSHLGDLSVSVLYSVLREHFEETCYHDHDCCGCYFGGISRIHKRGSRVTIKTSYSRNI